MGRKRVVADRILEIMHSKNDDVTQGYLKHELEARGFNHSWNDVKYNLEYLQDNYLVGSFGKIYFLLDNRNRQGMYEQALLEIREGMIKFPDKRAIILIYLLKGLEPAMNVIRKFEIEQNEKEASTS